jgi:adenosine kinase
MADYSRTYQELGIFSIFDPGQSLPAWAGEDLARCIRQSDMLVSNDYELALIKYKTGLSIEQLLEGVSTIITTRGEHGCEVLSRDGQSQTIPVIPTRNVVDPTGAGDAFRGGLIEGLIQGYPVERAAVMGTVCSHYVIQAYGTQKYSFTREEFYDKVEQHFGR